MNDKCIFCDPVADPVVLDNPDAFVIRDSFPTTEGHSLIIPKRHIAQYFDLSEEEAISCFELLIATKQEIAERDSSVTGFNVGINIGREAGQSIPHCHIHLIPRRVGDVDNPQGGVRHVIPGKGHYSK